MASHMLVELQLYVKKKNSQISPIILAGLFGEKDLGEKYILKLKPDEVQHVQIQKTYKPISRDVKHLSNKK